MVLARETGSLILGEGATHAQLEAIRTALVGTGVTSVIHLRTQYLGPEDLLVAAKIEVPGAASAADVAQAIDLATSGKDFKDSSLRADAVIA